jgi:hypothetical protein
MTGHIFASFTKYIEIGKVIGKIEAESPSHPPRKVQA